MDSTECYEQLATKFGVRPVVVAFETKAKTSWYCPSSRWALVEALLSGTFSRQTIETARYIRARRGARDGFVLLDSSMPLSCWNDVMAHEFVHAWQRRRRLAGYAESPELHDLGELEADVLSVKFLVERGVDVEGNFKEYKRHCKPDGLRNFLEQAFTGPGRIMALGLLVMAMLSAWDFLGHVGVL